MTGWSTFINMLQGSRKVFILLIALKFSLRWRCSLYNLKINTFIPTGKYGVALENRDWWSELCFKFYFFFIPMKYLCSKFTSMAVWNKTLLQEEMFVCILEYMSFSGCAFASSSVHVGISGFAAVPFCPLAHSCSLLRISLPLISLDPNGLQPAVGWEFLFPDSSVRKFAAVK